MDIIKKLEQHGVLFNQETLANILKPITSRENLKDSYLEEHRVFYYTADSRSLKDYSFHESEESVFKIVKFIHTKNFFSHPWCFGYFKTTDEEGNVTWRGAYAGRHGELFSKIKKVVRSVDGNKSLLSKVEFPRAITRGDIFKNYTVDEFADNLYEIVSEPSEWDCMGGIDGLKTYIKNITYVARDRVLFQKECPEEIMLVKEGKNQAIIFNSGLLDRYFNFIMFKVELEVVNYSFLREPYLAVKNISWSTSLSSYRLEEPLPIINSWGNSSLIFPSETISLVDRQGLDHMFTDRYTRLSLELQNCTPEVLYTSLNYSVNLALKLSKVDSQYLVPFLNMKWGKVSYLIPFYVQHIDSEYPLCAIVIGETSPGVWAPVTTLRLETARSNARLLGRLNASWLTNTKGGKVNEDSVSTR